MYTPEELETQRAEAVEAYKAEHPEDTEKVAQLEKDLAAAKEDLKKAGEKDQNFSNLRKKVEDLENELDTKVDSGVQNRLVAIFLEDRVKELAGGDAELEKKIRFAIDNSLKAVEPKNREEAQKKAQDAYLIATGGPPPGDTRIGGAGAVYGSGGANPPKPKDAKGTDLSPAAKELGKKLGLSEEDIKKHDTQNFSNTP